MRGFIVFLLICLVGFVVGYAYRAIREAAIRQEAVEVAPRTERDELLDQIADLVDVVYAHKSEAFLDGYMDAAEKDDIKALRYTLSGLQLRSQGKDPFGVFDPTPYLKADRL